MSKCTTSAAEALEKKGLWRRAAKQWLEVMATNRSSDVQQEAYQRRLVCLKQLKKQEIAPSLNLKVVNQAAKNTLKDMGIYRSRGDFGNKHSSIIERVYNSPRAFPAKYFNIKNN